MKWLIVPFAALALTGCVSYPHDMSITRVNETVYVIHDNNDYHPSVGIPQTCATDGRKVVRTVRVIGTGDTLVVVCSEPQ